MKLSLKYAHLFVLIFFFYTRTLFLLIYDVVYTYDEIVVTEISRQPTPLLFKTIVSEPHPPGFYLILKPFSELPDKTLKIIISFINFFISLLALLYFQNSKLFKKYNLALGLSFLFVSFNFLNISTTIKQDSISAPLFLLFLASILHLLENQYKNNLKHLMAANFITLSLLFFSYILYSHSIFLLTITTLFYKKKKFAAILLIAQIFILAFYFRIWLMEQILTNLNRFDWFSENYNSLFNSFSNHLIGFDSQLHFSEVILLAAFGLLFYFSIKTINSLPKIDLRFIVLILIILLTLLNYVVESYVRPRYSFGLYTLISFAMGYSLGDLIKKNKSFLILFLPFLTFGLFGFYTNQVHKNLEIGKIIEIYKELSGKSIHGVIDQNGGLFSQAILTKYKIGNIVPINIYYPNLYANKTSIDFELLLKEGKKPFQLNLQSAKNLISKNQLNNFIYSLDNTYNKRFASNDIVLLDLLQRSCQKSKTYKTYTTIFFVYHTCNFQSQ